MASIEKRGESSYRITVSGGYLPDGTKVVKRKSIKLDTGLTEKQKEKELERIAKEFEVDVLRGKVYDGNITLNQFVEMWENEYAKQQLEVTTLHWYKQELKTKILPALGHLKMDKIQPLHVTQFLNNLTEDGVRLDKKTGGYSTRTIKKNHETLSSIMQVAVTWRIIPFNPCRNASAPKGAIAPKRQRYLNIEQARDFLLAIEGEDIKYKTLVYIAVYGGLRLEDAYVKHGLKFFEIIFCERNLPMKKHNLPYKRFGCAQPVDN